MSEPSKEAMERAGVLGFCDCQHAWKENGHRPNCSTVEIARAIDAAVMEERGRLERELWERGEAIRLLEEQQALQPCGHPVACIISTGEGANNCGWCESEAKALYWHAKCVEGGGEE